VGFDPREAITLWQNMARAGGGAPPEFLSTHPSHATRIEDLNQRMPEALKLYDAARVAGRKPKCG
ncbi:MAG: M48 family metalloprotease, partial [Nevskiales bacterium]